jgi:(E)-4-hydroxy-3-methylbut-2-enyl-diphosphate synthase
LAEQVERLTAGMKQPLKIAVMGCAVNGPGEAREADLGVAGGKGEGLIFRKGEIIKKVPESEIIEALKEELEKLVNQCTIDN